MKPKFLRIATCVVVIIILMVPICIMAAEKINLNRANFEDLTKLKGIGPAYAQRIIPNFARVFEKRYRSCHCERQRSNLLVRGLLRRLAPRNDILRALRNSG